MEDGFGDFSTDIQEGYANARDAPAASAQEQACKFLMTNSEQRKARASTPTSAFFLHWGEILNQVSLCSFCNLA